MTLLLTGVAYTVGCIVAVAGGTFAGYSRGVAIAIAASAFLELGTAITGAYSTRRLWTPLVQANKLVNLAGGLVALALTQVAILSFTTDASRTTTANALFTLLSGLGVVGIGTRMALHGRGGQRSWSAGSAHHDREPVESPRPERPPAPGAGRSRSGPSNDQTDFRAQRRLAAHRRVRSGRTPSRLLEGVTGSSRRASQPCGSTAIGSGGWTLGS
jgi:hypothetical protein